MFDAFWAGFGRRLDRILSSLAHHSDMIDREANSINIARAEQWRRNAAEETKNQEESEAIKQFKSSLSWLKANDVDVEQENELDDKTMRIHANSCQWIQDHRKVQAWRSAFDRDRVLWIHGAPGAGKSRAFNAMLRSCD